MLPQRALRDRDRLEDVLLVLLRGLGTILCDKELVERLILTVEDALYLRRLRIVYDYFCPRIISITIPLSDPWSGIPQEHPLIDRREQSITYRRKVLRKVCISVRVYRHPRQFLKHLGLRMRV